MTHSMTMYDIESVSTASVQAKVEWKVDRTSLGATLRCLSSILASRTSRSMNYAIFHRRCIRATSFFPCRFPGKKLIFLPLHAYSHNSHDPLSARRDQARELILISMEACFIRVAIRRELFSKPSRMVFERIARLEFKKETLNSMPAPM